MNNMLATEKQHTKKMRITYYFTSIFLTMGTILVFYILFQMSEKLSIFIFILSLAGGGLPLGIIGVFIDYKISVFKLRTRVVKQLKEDL